MIIIEALKLAMDKQDKLLFNSVIEDIKQLQQEIERLENSNRDYQELVERMTPVYEVGKQYQKMIRSIQ